MVSVSLIEQLEQPPRWKRANTRRAPACVLNACSTVRFLSKCAMIFRSLRRRNGPAGCTSRHAKSACKPDSVPPGGGHHLSGAAVTVDLGAMVLVGPGRPN